MAIKYNYYGLEFINMPRDERPYYCRFAVHDKATGECVIEFYTNKDLEGMFVQRKNGTYRQTRGTCQYSLAGLGEKSVYHRLRNEANKAIEEANDIPSNKEMAAYFESDDFKNDGV
jgi:Zn-finger protein